MKRHWLGRGTGVVLGLAVLLWWGSTGVDAAEFTIRAGHGLQPKSEYDEGHQFLAREVANRTNGRVQIQVFPAAQLGQEVAMVEGLRLGSIDIATAHVANAATVVPELALFSVSYLFKDRDHFERFVNDPETFAKISQLIERRNLGIRLLAFYSAGVRNIYERVRPVKSPEDLRGLRLRVMNNPVEVKIWKTFGAIPTPMNFGEIYNALQTGVVDGAENSPSVVESNKHYESAPYLILTEHQRSLTLLMMGDKTYNKLPADLRKVIFDTAKEAGAYERKRDAELNLEAIEKMKARGAKIIVPEREKFAALIKPIQDEVAKELKVEDILALIRKDAK